MPARCTPCFVSVTRAGPENRAKVTPRLGCVGNHRNPRCGGSSLTTLHRLGGGLSVETQVCVWGWGRGLEAQGDLSLVQ